MNFKPFLQQLKHDFEVLLWRSNVLSAFTLRGLKLVCWLCFLILAKEAQSVLHPLCFQPLCPGQTYWAVTTSTSEGEALLHFEDLFHT